MLSMGDWHRVFTEQDVFRGDTPADLSPDAPFPKRVVKSDAETVIQFPKY